MGSCLRGREASLRRPELDGFHVVVLAPEVRPDGIRVFTATRPTEIERVGERATGWLAAQPDLELTELWIAQSSCRAFHCYSLCLWYRRRL